MEQLVANFERTWSRPPAPQELDAMVESHVREEVFYREALAMGLVTALHEDPLAAAAETAAAICAKSPDAIRAMKRLFNSAWRLTDAEALALEAELQLGVMGKKNQLEAVMANLQKRAPEFDD